MQAVAICRRLSLPPTPPHPAASPENPAIAVRIVAEELVAGRSRRRTSQRFNKCGGN